MFSRKYKKTYKPITLFLILVLVVFINYDKVKIREEINSSIDSIGTLSLGISGLPGLYGRSNMTEFGDGWLQVIKTLVVEFPKRISDFIPKLISSNFFIKTDANAIKNIVIDVRFDDWSTLMNDRSIALRDGILIDRNKVKFSGNHAGEKIRGKIRLKGDLSDHWRSRLRMSLLVELSENSASVNGFKRFAIHKPESRAHPYEQLFQRLASAVDIITVKHDYVKVVVNGENWGVMNIQETFSKELLEKQGYRNSQIIKLGRESEDWNISAKYGKNTGFVNGGVHYIDVLDDKIIDKSIVERNRLSYIYSSLRRGEFQNIVDTYKFAKLALLALVWGDVHVTLPSNSRYYLNPYTLRIEPVSADQSHFRRRSAEYYANVELPDVYRYALQAVTDNGELAALIDELDKVFRKLESYGAEITQVFPNDAEIDYSIIYDNFELIKNNGISIRNSSHERRDDLRVSLTEDEWAIAENHIVVNHYTDGRIELLNLLPEPITVDSISLHGINALAQPITMLPSYGKSFASVIKTPFIGPHDRAIEVKTRLGKYEKKTRNSLSLAVDYKNPFLIHSVTKNREFIVNNNAVYTIPKGNWVIHEPITVNGTLIIEPGVKLRFDESAYLLVNGAIFCNGVPEEPIVLSALNSVWKGIFVNGHERISAIVNTSINDTTYFSDGMLELTGGVNFYNTKLTLKNVKMENSIAEDGLNIVKSHFTIEGIALKNMRSDAIDIDFSQGSIVDGQIEDVNGDALDFSGTESFIERIKIRRVRDKGISAGEGSSIKLENIDMHRVGVGVASKDGSNVSGRNVIVDQFEMAAFMTYRKKNFYPFSSLLLTDSTASGVRLDDMLVRERNSMLQFNGFQPTAIKLNIKKLYQSEVMSK